MIFSVLLLMAPAATAEPLVTSAAASASVQTDVQIGSQREQAAPADVQAMISAAESKGYAAANARMSAVFASAEARSNPSLAAFLLGNSTASADAIVSQLRSFASTAGPTAMTAAAPAPVGAPAPSVATPNAAPAAVSARTTALEAEEKPVCRNVATSASRLGKVRVCKTRQEWGLSGDAQNSGRSVQSLQSR